MSVSKVRATVAVALVIAPFALLAVACSSAPPEQQTLSQFFRAARTRDNETLARMSAVEFSPREHGEVTRFEITSVSGERRTPLEFKPLIDAERKAVADELDFRKRRLEFESTNRSALEAIAKMERDPKARMTPAQQTMKGTWDKWRADAAVFQKAASAARSALAGATGPAEASLSQPGQPALVPEKFQGELISKDVTVNAQVSQNGQVTPKTLVITIQRVVGTMDGTQRQGRPVITRIQGA